MHAQEASREALKEHAAEKMTDTAWRERAARKAEVTKLFEKGRARAAKTQEKAQAEKARRARPFGARLRIVDG